MSSSLHTIMVLFLFIFTFLFNYQNVHVLNNNNVSRRSILIHTWVSLQLAHRTLIANIYLLCSSQNRIFSAIISAWLTSFPEAETTIPKLVQATIKVYSTITTELLPTPAKSHYTFNLRDLSKVFQGMLMAPSNRVKVLDTSINTVHVWSVVFFVHCWLLPCLNAWMLS